MGAITGIIQTAMVVVISIALVVGAGVGLYMWYTATGQEEGE